MVESGGDYTYAYEDRSDVGRMEYVGIERAGAKEAWDGVMVVSG